LGFVALRVTVKKNQKLKIPVMKQITLNTDQRIYVIPSGNGYSCFGFDNCLAHAQQLATLLGDEQPDPNSIGTLKLYEDYRRLCSRYAAANDINRHTYFDPGTPDPVKAVLEKARLTQKRIRIFLGDAMTGRSWLEEHDTIGRVGRSTGPQRVPLLIVKDSNMGGGAILTACIIAIRDKKHWLWKHDKFYVPQLEIRECPADLRVKGYTCGVWVDNINHANFKTENAANRWAAFIRGERFDR
jgi:hypothetical protein